MYSSEFEIGDEVLILSFHGPEKEGVVVNISSTYTFGTKKTEYGVKINSENGITYYASYDLQKVKKQSCVCGATSAHYPNTPPGHAHYCRVGIKEDTFWKDLV